MTIADVPDDGQGCCRVPECPRKSKRNCGGMRVCAMHGARFDRHGSFYVNLRVRSQRRVCAAGGCPEIEDGNAAYCKKHATRIRRHGSPHVVIPQSERRYRKGEASQNWNAEGSYAAVHQRLRKQRGPASSYPCSTCGKAAWHWAYDHEDPDEKRSEFGPFSVDLDRYKPMCVPCHKRSDLEVIRVNQAGR